MTQTLTITNSSFTVNVAHAIAILIFLAGLFSLYAGGKQNISLTLMAFSIAFYFLISFANKDKSTIQLNPTNLTVTKNKNFQILSYQDIQEIRPTVESFLKTKNMYGPLTLNFISSTTVYLYPKKGDTVSLGLISTSDLQKMQKYILKVASIDFMSKYF